MNIAEDSATNIAAFTDDNAGTVTQLTWATGAPSDGEFGITEAATDLLVINAAQDGTSGDWLTVIYGWV